MSSDQDFFALASGRQVRTEVARQLRRCPGATWQSLLAVLLLAGGGAANVGVPLLLGRVIDVVAKGAHQQLWQIALALVACAILAAVLSAGGFYLISRVIEQVIANLREEVMGTALGLPVHRVESAGSGDLVSRSTDDVAELSSAVSETVAMLTSSGVTLVATFFALVSLDWQFILVALTAVPVYVLGARRYLRAAPQRYAAERAAMAQRAQRVLESIHGRHTVRAYRWEKLSHARILEASREVADKGFRARTTMVNLQVWMAVAELLMLSSALLVSYALVSSSAMSIGGVTSAILMLIRLHGPIQAFMRVLDSVQSGYASLARIVGVTLDPPQPIPDSGAPAPKGHVEVREVSFSYGSEWAVKNVSLDIPPGTTLALVGASGAGKSTVATLIAGLQIPDSGQVLIDAMPVTALSDRERASRLSMVTQEVHVFSGTLRDDLHLAAPHATDEHMVAALSAVRAHWWEKLSEGLDTEIGARGVQLGPMEAQQLALARIMLLDPAVVVLDEATAEAGSVGAGELEEAVEAVTRGRSALIVAHRLDQAARADCIAVMADGELIEQGSHDELVAEGGVYADMWSAWSAGR